MSLPPKSVTRRLSAFVVSIRVSFWRILDEQQTTDLSGGRRG
jgi:hypothetical protein